MFLCGQLKPPVESHRKQTVLYFTDIKLDIHTRAPKAAVGSVLEKAKQMAEFENAALLLLLSCPPLSVLSLEFE